MISKDGSENDEPLPNDKTDDDKSARMSHIEYQEAEPSTLFQMIKDDLVGTKEPIEPEFEIEQRKDRRYEVALPLVNGQTPTNNFAHAYGRLGCTQAKLVKANRLEVYENKLMEDHETDPSTSSAKPVDLESNSTKEGSEPKLENEQQDSRQSEVASHLVSNQKPCYEPEMLPTSNVSNAALDQVKAPLPELISLWPEETSSEDEQAAMSSFEASDDEPRTVTPVAPSPVKDEDKDVEDSIRFEERNANKSDRSSASSNKDKFYHKKWPNPFGTITCNLDGHSAAGSFGTDPNVYPHCHRGPELILSYGPGGRRPENVAK